MEYLNLTMKTFEVKDSEAVILSPPHKWRKKFKDLFLEVSLETDRFDTKDRFMEILEKMLQEQPKFEVTRCVLYAPPWALGPIEAALEARGFRVCYVLFKESSNFLGDIIG